MRNDLIGLRELLLFTVRVWSFVLLSIVKISEALLPDRARLETGQYGSHILALGQIAFPSVPKQIASYL